MIHPGVQFKAVERDALSTDRDFSEVGSDFRVEAVAVHAEVARRIPEAEEPRDESCRFSGYEVHAQLASTAQVHGRDSLAFVAEFAADGQPCLEVLGFLFRDQRVEGGGARGRASPAGQFLVSLLDICMTQTMQL